MRRDGSSDSRAASTAPAEPPPTMMSSYSIVSRPAARTARPHPPGRLRQCKVRSRGLARPARPARPVEMLRAVVLSVVLDQRDLSELRAPSITQTMRDRPHLRPQLTKLDRRSRVLVAAVSAHETIRRQS